MSRDVLACIFPTPCAECHFTIFAGQDMVLGDWGWTHLLCADEVS